MYSWSRCIGLVSVYQKPFHQFGLGEHLRQVRHYLGDTALSTRCKGHNHFSSKIMLRNEGFHHPGQLTKPNRST